VLVALTCLGATAAALAKDDAPKLPLADLSLEVAALQTLYTLQPTPEQMKALQEFARKTAQQPANRRAGKATDNYRDALAELRQALIEATDDERVDELEDRVDKLRDEEKPTLDDAIEMTDKAVEAAPQVLRLFTARQVAAYAGAVADDIADPLETILDAAGKVRDMDDKQWKEFRTTTTETIGMLLGGVDAERSAAYRDKTLQLLIVVRGLSAAEFKQQRAGLEKKARAIVGDVGPLDVVRHYLEDRLAELLSNPRLSAALEARLKFAERGR
jgi:hypothetical protein